jgi:hypothetical protein
MQVNQRRRLCDGLRRVFDDPGAAPADCGTCEQENGHQEAVS